MLGAAGCGENLVSYRPIDNVNDLEGRRVGVALAWAPDYILGDRDGKDLQLFRYDTNADMLMALCYKQIDAMALDATTWEMVNYMQPGLRKCDEPLSSVGYIYYLPGTAVDLKKQINEYIDECSRNGELDKLDKRLADFHGGDYEWPKGLEPTGTGKTLKVAYVIEDYPYSYITPDGKAAGIELEFVVAFANKYNYRLELIGSSLEDVYMGAAKGKYDICVGAIADVYAKEAESLGLGTTDVYLNEDIYLIEVDDPSKLTQGADLGM